MEGTAPSALPSTVPPVGSRLVVFGVAGSDARSSAQRRSSGVDVVVVDLATSIPDFPPPARHGIPLLRLGNDPEFLSGGTGRQRRGRNLELDTIVQQVPMRRAGRPEDVAATALFLAGPAASYLTAQTIHINGGLWS